jgi:hypothetical protein
MKTFIFGATIMLSFAASLWPNSGYDNGPPRSRGPGSGLYWQGEPGATVAAPDRKDGPDLRPPPNASRFA